MSFAALPNAVLFAVVGLSLFTVALIMLLRALPGRLWTRALEDGNIAAAMIVAAIVLALGWIVAATVH
jgi:uncharacterized membrane protein YjfL (UPF0719 family)